MKILGFDKKSGVAKVKIDSLDDLWHLSKIIEGGDLVSGSSSRKVKLGDEEERQKSIKRKIYVQIEVVEAELGDHLKVHGLVQNEVEDIPLHSAHSLDIELGTVFEIQKEIWREFQIKRLKEAEESSTAPKALVCVLDDERATLAYLTASGYTLQGRISLRLSRKLYIEKQKKPQEDIDKLIGEIKEKDSEKIDVIILASPLFWKEIVSDRIKELYPKLWKKIHLENTTSGDERGVRELVEGSALDKITKRSQSAKESQLVESLLTEIAKDRELATYGLENVSELVPTGAVKSFLITDSKLAELKESIMEVIDNVEKLGGEVHIINSKGEAGRKLNGLGGIGVMLRYSA